MKIGSRLIQYPIHHPKLIISLLVIFTLITGSLISFVHVDTDPENMLSEDEAVRVYHNLVKKEFTLYDMVVLGVVNEKHPDGVFNPQTLAHVHELTEFAKTLSHPTEPDKKVVGRDIIAPGNVDTIKQAGLGQVRFEWLMPQVPKTREEALEIRDSAMGNHMLKGTLVSEDGKAIGIYIPITSKDFAHFVREKLLEKIDSFSDAGDDQFFITGLPVAEDTFGKEMFVQMAVSAPLAMLAIFLLMLVFFKKISLIISPMIIAMMSVLSTMGLLIGTGNTLHIMSSMIPIFLMPIAVVDSIHILSEFFDEYQKIKDRRKTIEHVLNQLFMPMLYTSLTSSAGFASLALTPIPPVQAFGIFVALGIMFAWFITIIFIPAYVMLLKEETLENFGTPHHASSQKISFLSSFLKGAGRFTYSQSKLILVFTIGMLFVSVWGISKINVNDNPIKWFTKDHEIRIADRVLNSHFGGTYEAYLVLETRQKELSPSQTAELLMKSLTGEEGDKTTEEVLKQAKEILVQTSLSAKNSESLLQQVEEKWSVRQEQSSDAEYDIWIDLTDKLNAVKNRDQIFKNPEMLRYIDGLQQNINQSGVVGKSNSVTDVVKKVHQELFEGKNEFYTVPDTINAVAQCLISFQNSHKPDDLWHFVTPDYQKANIWVQLKNGDNQVMEELAKKVKAYMAANPPPFEIEQKWAGLTYLNVVWQDKMVTGMQEAFLSSFIIVFLMMVLLFRSPTWGFLAMIPLSVTIALIYGIIGFIGKDYDMPVAVLSSLTLGLAVDFAIHFLERSRAAYRNTGSWSEAIKNMFEEPARAISRNVIVVAVGFTPLLAAPLVPYKTVGIFLASIMAISGFGTMIILPAAITVLQGRLFKKIVPPGTK
ncbi:MAG: MMPL family transporter [Desulfobulbaceae bacterium]|nr:MMPL family transporter [Desulfobulbaceae bacterium]